MKKFVIAFVVLCVFSLVSKAAIYVYNYIQVNGDGSRTFYGMTSSPDQGRLLSVTLSKFDPNAQPGFQWVTQEVDLIEPTSIYYWTWTSLPLGPGDYYISVATITTSHVEKSFTVP